MKTILDLTDMLVEASPEKCTYNFIDNNNQLLSVKNIDFYMRTLALAAELQNRNSKGERALLLLPSSVEFVYAMFACFYSGTVAVPAYPPLTEEMSQRILSFIVDADIKYLITNSEIEKKLKLSKWLGPLSQIMKKIPSSKLQKKATVLQAGAMAAKLEIICVDKIDVKLAADYKRVNVGNNIAYLQYTSGSVSRPKGVVVTHENLVANLKIIKTGFGLDQDSVLTSWLPLYHDMGLISTIITPIYLQCKTISMSPFKFLVKPSSWLEAMSKYKSTATGAPDFAYRLCVKKISEEEKEKIDLSSLKILFSGSEKIRLKSMEMFHEKFATCGLSKDIFFPCYGLAEATLYVSGRKGTVESSHKKFKYMESDESSICQPVQLSDQGKPIISVGSTVHDTNLLIIDPDNKSIKPDDTIGEICVSGKSIMPSYWNNELETNNVLIQLMHEGKQHTFLRTGDIGFIHENELYIVGRLKEMIIIAGKNHYPHDIEDDLDHDGLYLRHGSVIAFSIDEDDREKLVIVAEVKSDSSEQHKNAIILIKESLSKYHQLIADDIVLVKTRSIPKTSSGKLKRTQCKLNYINGTLEVLASMNKSL